MTKPTVADLQAQGLTVPVQMAADALGISPGTVRSGVKTGRIPGFAQGRVIKVQTDWLVRTLTREEPAGPTADQLADAVAESVRRALAGAK